MVYHVHNPAKLDDVDALLAKHAKAPERLYEAVLGKYAITDHAASFFAGEKGWEAAMQAEAEAKARAEAKAKAQAQREQAKLKNEERIAARKLKEEETARQKAANAAKIAEAAQRRAEEAARVTPEEAALIEKKLAKAAAKSRVGSAARTRNRIKREEVEKAQEEAKAQQANTGFVVSGGKVHKKTFGSAKPNAYGGRDEAAAAAARREKQLGKFKATTDGNGSSSSAGAGSTGSGAGAAKRRADPGSAREETGMRLSGIALRWNDSRGFGFIRPDNVTGSSSSGSGSSSGSDQQLFCHVSGIVDGSSSLIEGEVVTYEEEYNVKRGKHNAVAVRHSSSSSSSSSS
jgi:cold shock CspA family protein